MRMGFFQILALILGLGLPVVFIYVVTTYFATPKRFNEHDQKALLEKRLKKKQKNSDG
ncbi:hypothetical protein [Deinococcus misasensis]|uniref:hypothetical protein n=1 Tax=Deinococcus misasensis TaxID=392413 RepID=UPI0012F9EF6A|nr:hypothetical protein [Deinococcus misasensis]